MKTREEWLEAAVNLIQERFVAAGYEIPTVRVACGWPSTGGTSPSKRRLGEAWSCESAADGVPQIFISPFLADVSEPQGVLATLIHELVHATVGNKQKHNKVFGRCARAVGLIGKLTATEAGPELLLEIAEWAMQLGAYPHSKLDLCKGPDKKQTTRMLKMECQKCGYVCRSTKKWILEVGVAWCPKHGEMALDNPEDLEDSDDNNDDNE